MNEQERQHQISKIVLDTIEERGISPRPKWHFALRNDVFWGVAILTTILGSFAVAITIYSLTQIEPEDYYAGYEHISDFLLDWVPFLWVILFATFGTIAYLNIRHTENGYRYSLLSILSLMMSVNIIGGVTLHTLGASKFTEQGFARAVPMYRPIEERRHSLWLNPNEGRVLGMITEVNNENGTFTLLDRGSTTWVLSTRSLHDPDRDQIVVNQIVRVIIATSTVDGIPVACIVMPPDPRPRIILPPPQETLRERNINQVRSSECEGVRPYKKIRTLQEQH